MRFKFDLWSRVSCGGDGGSGTTGNSPDYSAQAGGGTGYSGWANAAGADWGSGSGVGFGENWGAANTWYEGPVFDPATGVTNYYSKGQNLGPVGGAPAQGGITDVPTGTVAAPPSQPVPQQQPVVSIPNVTQPTQIPQQTVQQPVQVQAPTLPTDDPMAPEAYGISSVLSPSLTNLDDPMGPSSYSPSYTSNVDDPQDGRTAGATAGAYASPSFDEYVGGSAPSNIGQSYINDAISAPAQQGWSAPAFGDGLESANVGWDGNVADYDNEGLSGQSYDWGGIEDYEDPTDGEGLSGQSYLEAGNDPNIYDENNNPLEIPAAGFPSDPWQGGWGAPEQYTPDVTRDVPQDDPMAPESYSPYQPDFDPMAPESYGPATPNFDAMAPDAYSPATQFDPMSPESYSAPFIDMDPMNPESYFGNRTLRDQDIGWTAPAYGDKPTNAGFSTVGVPTSGAKQTLAMTPADIIYAAKVLGKEGLERLAEAHKAKYGGTIEEARKQAALAHMSVVTNRAVTENKSIRDVLTAPNQFTPLNNTRLDSIPRNTKVENLLVATLPDLPKYAFDTQYLNFLNKDTSGAKAMREWGNAMPVGTVIGNPDAKFSHSFGNASGKAVPAYDITFTGNTYNAIKSNPAGFEFVNDLSPIQAMNTTPVAPAGITALSNTPRSYEVPANRMDVYDPPAGWSPPEGRSGFFGDNVGQNIGNLAVGTAAKLGIGAVGGPLGILADFGVGALTGRSLSGRLADAVAGPRDTSASSPYTDYGLAINPSGPMNTALARNPDQTQYSPSVIPGFQPRNPEITGQTFMDQQMRQNPDGTWSTPQQFTDPALGGDFYGAQTAADWARISGMGQQLGDYSLNNGYNNNIGDSRGEYLTGASAGLSSNPSGSPSSTTAPPAPDPIPVAGQNVRNQPVFPNREVPEPYRSMLIQSGYGLDGLGGWNFFPNSGDSRAVQRGGMATGGLVQGAGTETSDSVPAIIDGSTPAALSSGEFVFTGAAVRGMGGGDRMEGARRLHAMMKKAEGMARKSS